MKEISNFYERTLALLASQFQGIPTGNPTTNFQKLIFAVTTQGQAIQTQLSLLYANRSLDIAQGVQLDGLGEILGLTRVPGQSDTDYRLALQFQVYIDTSSGTAENVIAACKFFTTASNVIYFEDTPASYQLISDGTTYPETPSDIVQAIQSMSPAGVKFIGLTATFGEYPFIFATDYDIHPLYVSLDPSNPQDTNPFEVSTSNPLDVSIGSIGNPEIGGHFAEAGNPIDTEGAGRFSEIIQL